MTSPKESCRLAIIIVTYNSAPLLGALDRSLQSIRSPHTIIAVVDSASSDPTAELARACTSIDRVITLPSNRGYAAAVNAGVESIRATGGADAFFFMNPDVELAPGAIEILRRGPREDRVGIVAPKLLDEHGRLQFSQRHLPSLGAIMAEALLGGPLASRVGLPVEVIRDAGAYEHRCEVGWTTGGAILVTDHCLRETGPWDEAFFLYDEEVDFAIRANAAGFTTRYEPAAVAVRTVGGDEQRRWVRALTRVNRVALVRKHQGRGPALAAWTVMIVGEAVRALAGRSNSRAALRSLLGRWSPARIITEYGPRSVEPPGA